MLIKKIVRERGGNRGGGGGGALSQAVGRIGRSSMGSQMTSHCNINHSKTSVFLSLPGSSMSQSTLYNYFKLS